MSIQTLDEFIARVEAVVRLVDGVRHAPDFPPDALNAWPAIVTYAAKGYTDVKNFGLGQSYHDVACEVHVPRKDLARALQTLRPFVSSIPKALADDTQLNQYYGAMIKISYSLFNESYGGVETIGYRFVIEKVKLDQ